MQEELEMRRRRLSYRARHRGTKELDLFVGNFAERHLHSFDGGQIDRFEAILEQDEHDIYRWLTGQDPVPPEHDNDVMALLLNFDFAGSLR